MAATALRTELKCSICMSLYTDPVTLRCGHNFCWDCIDQVLNTQDEAGVYSCPECRAEFQQRPVLHRNITLCNIVEHFPSTQSQEWINEIFCTYCIHSPVPAVKSCLHCEASLCDNHMRVHSKGPEHVLTDPSTNMEDRKCSIHKEVLKYYCTQDTICICMSCSLAGEHRGHRVKMLDEASENKKKKMKNVLQELITKREETEERIQSLGKHRRKTQEKASLEAKRVTALFLDMRRWMDSLEKKVLSEISRQEEQRSLSLSHMIQKLEIKKDELSRKMRHIEELCNMADPLTVLQDPDTRDLYDPEEDGGDMDTSDLYCPEDDGDDGGTREHDRGDHCLELISRTLQRFSDIIRDVNVTFYGQGPADILLDPYTAANDILLSDDLKIATRVLENQDISETADLFYDTQVMSSTRFTSGRHYWDVEISGLCWCKVGMCYPSIDRSGHPSVTGDGNKSWGLFREGLFTYQCSVIHDSKVIQLPHQNYSNRFRIYLDYEAGQLSFYELCDPIRHLHTFTATFTEPLHAVLGVWEGSIKVSGEQQL